VCFPVPQFGFNFSCNSRNSINSNDRWTAENRCTEENIKQWGEKREEQIHFTNNIDNNDSRNAYARECGLSAKNIRLEGPRLTMKLKLN